MYPGVRNYRTGLFENAHFYMKVKTISAAVDTYVVELSAVFQFGNAPEFRGPVFYVG